MDKAELNTALRNAFEQFKADTYKGEYVCPETQMVFHLAFLLGAKWGAKHMSECVVAIAEQA